MGQGRKKKLDRPARLVVKIPTSLLTAYEDKLYDPITNKIPMSARADVISNLLRNWLRGKDGQIYHQLVQKLVDTAGTNNYESSYKALITYHKKTQKLSEELDQPTKLLDLSNLLG